VPAESDGPVPVRSSHRPRRTRLSEGLGLRARVTATFAIGAFALSTLMAGITYFTARQSYLNERQGADQRQTFANALLVQNALRSPATQPAQLIGSAGPLPGSYSVLHSGGHWYATSISVGQGALPDALQSLVLEGSPATQIVSVSGSPQLAIGIPLPSVHAAYFEFFSLDELQSTLRTLAFTLAAAALVTTLAGAALGRWASGRALRPLAGVTEAAVAVAGGELDTRVEAGDDVDLQELASAFNQMTANLQDRIEREARFTSDVSHELRSPLTTLTATVGVLEGHRDELSPRARSALDLLDGDLHRFTRMVDDLLEISRFDAGSAELSLDEVDPGELVRRAVASTAPVGPDGRRSTVSVPVEIGAGVDGLRLRVDKRRFERVMANLTENAELYAGGVSRVMVERNPPEDGDGGGGSGEEEAARSIRVIVEDEGPGVPKDERDHLFERFYRGSRAGQRASSEGTGLGLSLVAEHVRLHGGAVTIEDAAGGGSRFIVELPLATEGAAWDPS
jgi:two-component system sensor histidine kinase MtrB